ncbi:hypothetical protein QVD17_05747 [Tagetes erecta]|uniref:Uncharacterized protein n=1 Tax=Tagetes erecta TaxID=13708 RepID=A0AAD8PBQ8_TARER|nr:hypothetical protein QVD17_05747 [Tagetes erecta]
MGNRRTIEIPTFEENSCNYRERNEAIFNNKKPSTEKETSSLTINKYIIIKYTHTKKIAINIQIYHHHYYQNT